MADSKTDDELISCRDEKCNLGHPRGVGEDEDVEGYNARFYNRCQAHFTNALILAAIIVTGLFYLDLEPRRIELPSATLHPPARLVRYDTPSLNATTTSSAVAAATGLTVDLGVYQPVLTPAGLVDQTISNDGTRSTAVIASAASNGTCATMVLMDYSFGQSYGAPFVGTYTPPNCNFNRVVVNFTVTSRGRQFDRLAMFYLNNTEIWRTSTEEPTSKGIEWTYFKDLSEYLALWKEPQKIIFDLPNNIDATYTGFYNTTLTATFFQSDAIATTPADMIIPVTAEKAASNSASLWMLPQDNASSTVSFPQNANRAVFSVSACGQANEEFWWGNVLSNDSDTFNASGAGTLFGGSAWREVQILIDGQLAGVQWPFPVIFTGGVLPTLWEPIVGLDAFDLREHEIDITPWLPQLCDGNQHSFEIRVASLGDSNGDGIMFVNDTTASSWYVTGKVFIWLDDDAGSVTTGSQILINNPGPRITTFQDVTQNATGTNTSLINQITVQRTLTISSTVSTKKGNTSTSWTQTLSFSNNGSITNIGNAQVNYQNTQGVDQAVGNTNYKSTYEYPLFVNTTNTLIGDAASGNSRYDVAISRGINLQIEGTSVYPTGLEPFSVLPNTASIISNSAGSILNTNANSTASLISVNGSGTSTFGSTAQDFSFASLSRRGAMGASMGTELYRRGVEAVNGSVVTNTEVVGGNQISDFRNGTAVDRGDVVSLLEGDMKVLGMRVRQGNLRVWERLGL